MEKIKGITFHSAINLKKAPPLPTIDKIKQKLSDLGMVSEKNRKILSSIYHDNVQTDIFLSVRFDNMTNILFHLSIDSDSDNFFIDLKGWYEINTTEPRGIFGYSFHNYYFKGVFEKEERNVEKSIKALGNEITKLLKKMYV